MTPHDAATQPFGATTKAKVTLGVTVEIERRELTNEPALTLAEVSRTSMDAVYNAIKDAENRGHDHDLAEDLAITNPVVIIESVEYLT